MDYSRASVINKSINKNSQRHNVCKGCKSAVKHTVVTLAEKSANANSELYEFWGVLEEYEANPEVVKARIYSNKLTSFLKRLAYVRVVEDGEMKIFLKPLA